MIKWLPVVFICLFIAYQRGLLRMPASTVGKPTVELLYSLPEKHDLNCRGPGRERCLVVYVAPWCGACKQFLTELFPTVLLAMSKYPNAGLEIVVGADQESAIRNMGQALGRPYIADPKGRLFDSFGMRVYPSFVGLTKTGKILQLSDGFRAQGSSIEEAAANFLEEHLK